MFSSLLDFTKPLSAPMIESVAALSYSVAKYGSGSSPVWVENGDREVAALHQGAGLRNSMLSSEQ